LDIFSVTKKTSWEGRSQVPFANAQISPSANYKASSDKVWSKKNDIPFDDMVKFVGRGKGTEI